MEAHTALTPGVNVHRVPTNGRNWEYVSGQAPHHADTPCRVNANRLIPGHPITGEDAHLGTIAAELTKGIQSDGAHTRTHTHKHTNAHTHTRTQTCTQV